MFYFITITRNGKRFYVVSPNWGEYVLSPTKEKNTYLWSSQEDCEKDSRWKHLIKDGDKVEYNPSYRG